MRRVVIWILVIILVFGFVYVGNNIFAGYTGSKTKSLLGYIPEVPLLLKFNKQNLQSVEVFYHLPNFVSYLDFGKAYVMETYDGSSLIVFNTLTSISEVLRTLTETLKAQNKFTLKKKWERGFPVVYAFDADEKYFISGWRNFIFISKISSALEPMFNGITGQGKYITNDSSFEKLWNRNNDFECFIADKAYNPFNDKINIPFYHFNYPLSFTMNNNTMQIYYINQSIENTLIPIYHFDNAVMEISSSNIIPELADNDLSIVFSEKTGLFYDKLAAVFSNIPSEFVFYKDNEFSLILSSNPTNNAEYNRQIRVLLPKDVKVKSKMSDNYVITQYITQRTNFYTLTAPNLFIISTEKNAPLKTISSSNFKNAILFIKINKALNNTISFYHLFLGKIVVPNGFTQCNLLQTNISKEGIIKTEINFSG